MSEHEHQPQAESGLESDAQITALERAVADLASRLGAAEEAHVREAAERDRAVTGLQLRIAEIETRGLKDDADEHETAARLARLEAQIASLRAERSTVEPGSEDDHGQFARVEEVKAEIAALRAGAAEIERTLTDRLSGLEKKVRARGDRARPRILDMLVVLLPVALLSAVAGAVLGSGGAQETTAVSSPVTSPSPMALPSSCDGLEDLASEDRSLANEVVDGYARALADALVGDRREARQAILPVDQALEALYRNNDLLRSSIERCGEDLSSLGLLPTEFKDDFADEEPASPSASPQSI